MTKENQLCQKCHRENNGCQFERVENRIADRINSGQIDLYSGYEKIIRLRESAREKRPCSQINNVNPFIKGL
jgi:hypothetical protein